DRGDGKEMKKKAEAPGRFVNGDEEVAVSLAPAGDSVVVEHFRAGAPVGSVRIERQGDLAVAKDASGATLYTASPTADGGRLIAAAWGAAVASSWAAETRSRPPFAR